MKSHFDSHLFMAAYTDSDTVPASGTELQNVISFTPPTITKDVARYKTLDGDGWDTIAPLGQSQGDMVMNFVRAGVDDVFDGTAGTGASAYESLKAWALGNASVGGAATPKCIIFVKPRGTSYEGTCIYVIPTSFSDGEANENTGQEFSITVAPFGPPVPVTVTKTGSTFSFAAVS
jgi:hypothetical protein